MKTFRPNLAADSVGRASSRAGSSGASPHQGLPRSARPIVNRQSSIVNVSAFTLIEVAISLAVIGVALVAIIGVLPLGMNVQRENREGTIINQDATIFLEAISKGARGMNDLTNYVYAITNFWTQFDANGNINGGGGSVHNGYTFNNSSIAPGWVSTGSLRLTNGYNIIGILSTPQFTDLNGRPIASTLGVSCYSNRVFAYVRSLSGPATEKPPQDNPIVQEGAFGYRLLCVNAPVAVDTNVFGLSSAQQGYSRQLNANLHELRLTFQWPILPNGKVGVGRQSYRTLIAGKVSQIFSNNVDRYFYQPQAFTNAP